MMVVLYAAHFDESDYAMTMESCFDSRDQVYAMMMMMVLCRGSCARFEHDYVRFAVKIDVKGLYVALMGAEVLCLCPD